MEIYSKEGPSTWYKIRSGYQYRGSKEQVRERFGRDGPRRNSKIPFCILFCWLGDLMETESTCSVPYGWAWERQIQLIPSLLSSLMREYGHTLDDESFRTLLTKVECILNSQPLSTPSGDPRNSDPLTPSHVLTLKSRVVMPPPGNFQETDVCLRTRWKGIQYFSKVFWSRWRKDSIQNLQQRVKWNRPRRNFVKVDLVLIIDDRVPNMARVVEAHSETVKVTAVGTTLECPIDNLVLLLENEEWNPG